MYFSAGVDEVQEPSRKDRDRVFLVVDVCQTTTCESDVLIDIVCEGLVADTRHAVADGAEDGRAGKVQRQEYGVKQCERGAERVADDSNLLRGRMAGEGLLHCGKDVWRRLRVRIQETTVCLDGRRNVREQRGAEARQEEIGIRQIC